MLSCSAAQGHDIIRLDAEDVSGPCIECRRPLAGEVIALVDAGNTAQLGGLMGEQFINDNAIETKLGQFCNPGSAKIMKAPRS